MGERFAGVVEVWVCLGVCAGFVVWGVEGVRTALHLSQGRAGWGVV